MSRDYDYMILDLGSDQVLQLRGISALYQKDRGRLVLPLEAAGV